MTFFEKLFGTLIAAGCVTALIHLVILLPITYRWCLLFIALMIGFYHYFKREFGEEIK